MEKRLLPIGISDFKKIIEENYTYVDKTNLIQEILEESAGVLLFPRPRRFGKTLNLSMLRYFFEKSDESRSHLFVNLNIWKTTKYREYQGKFPVIFLTLKDVKEPHWDKAYNKLKILISEEFRRHSYLLETDLLDLTEKEDFQKIIARTASQEIYEDSLKTLCKYLQKYHKENAIILIDEYDTPVIEAYLNKYYKEMVDFMRSWLAGGLKDNLHLERGILTGILRVAKESFFSDLNNISTFSVLSDEFGDKFGFTEQELAQLLDIYQLTEKSDEMRKWYNGYRVGQNTVYNPWSILTCISKKGVLNPYWVNTSANEILKQVIIKKGNESVKEDIEQLLTGDVIVKPIDERINFKVLDNNHVESIWTLLLFSGYLTLASPPLVGGNPNCSLKIPNQEVFFSYIYMIMQWFSEDLKFHMMDQFYTSLISGNIDKFSTFLADFIQKILSYHDVGGKEPEIFYHAFVLGLLACLINTHEVKSNQESGNGRFDVIIIPKSKDQLGIVMEFKKSRSDSIEELDTTANSALQQIEDKNYSQVLRDRGITQILGIGLAFNGKHVKVKQQRIEPHKK